MFSGDGHDDSASDWSKSYSYCNLDKEKLEKALAVVRKYAFIYEMIPSAKKELEEAMLEIERQRIACAHDFREVMMFTSIETACIKCGKKRS